MKNEASNKKEDKVIKGALDQLIKRHLVLALLTFAAVVMVGGTATYALFQIDKQNTTNQNIAVGNLSASITSQTGKIVLNDLFPKLSTELPEDYKYYEFTVLNDGDYDLKYEVYLKDATDTLLSSSTEYSEYKRIDTSYYKYINFILDDGPVKNLESVLKDGKFMLLSGTMEPGYSKSHKIKFFIDKGETTTEGAPNDLSGSILSLDVYLDAGVYDPASDTSATKTLLAKVNDASITNYDSGNKGEMFTFTHPEAEQTTGWSEEERTDYRYIGANPNNYVNFNDETWRIIGVFTVENGSGVKEQRIKIIREASIGSFTWDKKSDGTYINEWPTSSLATMLNGDYVNSGGTFTYIWYNSSGTATNSTVQGLNSTAKSQISPAKWYLGGSSTYQNLGGPDYYNFERGTTTCVTTGKCSGQTRSTNIVANVGLMYPSDYIYTYSNGVDNTCYTDGYSCKTSTSGTPTNGWLHNSLSTSTEWLISPYASYSDRVFYLMSSGYVYSGGSGVYNTIASRPTVYLRSDIQITGGDGASIETAYTISAPTN